MTYMIDGFTWFVANGNVIVAPPGSVVDVTTGLLQGRVECTVQQYRHFWASVYNRLGLPEIDADGNVVEFALR